MDLRQRYDIRVEDFQTYLETIQDLLREPSLKFDQLPLDENLLDSIIYDFEDSYERELSPFGAVERVYLDRFNLTLK